MPRAPSSEPLQRTDLNLYAADIDFLKRTYGQGWTTYIRELVRKDVEAKPRVRTVGDIINGK